MYSNKSQSQVCSHVNIIIRTRCTSEIELSHYTDKINIWSLLNSLNICDFLLDFLINPKWSIFGVSCNIFIFAILIWIFLLLWYNQYLECLQTWIVFMFAVLILWSISRRFYIQFDIKDIMKTTTFIEMKV